MDQAWLVNGDQLSIVSCDGNIKLFSGDCYILKYTYLGSQRDESILYAWLGTASIKVRAMFPKFKFVYDEEIWMLTTTMGSTSEYSL